MLVNMSLRGKSAKGIARDIYKTRLDHTLEHQKLKRKKNLFNLVRRVKEDLRLRQGMALKARTMVLEIKLRELEAVVKRKSYSGNLVLARIREVLDSMSNVKKEDRVIPIGLTNSTLMPEDPANIFSCS